MECSLKYFAFLVLIVAVSAQHISDKPCPERPIVQNFDVKNHTSGTWYEILRYDAVWAKDYDCATANFEFKDDQIVGLRYCHKKLTDNNVTCRTGEAKLSEPDHVPLEGKINVNFVRKTNDLSNYLVLDTDYANYAIVYGCFNKEDNKSVELAWLLSRSPKLSPEVQDVAFGLIDKYFDRSVMIQTNHHGKQCGRK